jgi:hypothetical protein
MAIPRIHYSQLLEIMKQIKSSGAVLEGAVLVADKDKPPSAKMFEEIRRVEEDEAHDDYFYWDEYFFGL